MRKWNKVFKIGIFGNTGKIGDELVCLPAYYTIKHLYPKSFLTLLCNTSVAHSIFSHLNFIDEITTLEAYKNKMGGAEFDILLVINHNNLKILQKAKNIPAKRRITTFSQSLMLRHGILFISGFERFINPYWFQTHREVQRNLNLVREIDPILFDKHFPSINLEHARLQTALTNKIYIDKILLDANFHLFDQIVGISPFSESSTRKKMNFELNDWLKITRILSRNFPSFLFILLSYQKTIISQKYQAHNIIIFQNNNDLLNLVELTSRLNFLISIDTGNVHIADNLKIPILEIISKKTRKQWSGGAYGGFCKIMSLPINWQKHKQKYFFKFLSLALSCLKNLAKNS